EGPPNTPETLCLAMDLSERRRAEERIRIIVECSKILASSLECEKTLPEVAEFVVSKLADSCAIFVHEDEELNRIASACKIPVGQSVKADREIETVLMTGKSHVTASPFSRVISPITTRNEVAGVLVVSCNRTRAFDNEDLHLFDELGRRAGLALESARMY